MPITKIPFLTDAHHFALANVMVRSSQLEHHIEMTIETLMDGQENSAKFLLKNLGGDRIAGFLLELLKDARLPTITDAEATKLVTEIKRVRDERNSLMHLAWGSSDLPGQAVQGDYRPFRERRRRNVSAAFVETIASDLSAACLELVDVGSAAREGRKLGPNALRPKPAPPIPESGSLLPPPTKPDQS